MFFNKKANTLIELLVVVAIIAAVAAIAIPNILRARVESNSSVARSTLKAIAVALENYQITNGIYPADIDALRTVSPPYLNKDYFSKTYAGFDFSVNSLTDYTYSVTAVPVDSNLGTTSYTVTTGGVLSK